MRALIAFFLACFALNASAGAVFQTRTVTVRLSDQPCDGVAAALLGEDDAKAFRHADVTVRGKTISGCWTLQDDKVLLVDDEGDAGNLPAAQFKTDGA